MLHTVLERFAESRVEWVLGYSRVVHNVASIVALRTAAMEEVHGAFQCLSASSRDVVLERVRDGHLEVRVLEGHVSHAKIFLGSSPVGGEILCHAQSFIPTSTSGQLWVDSRTPSSIARKCFSPRALTPMTTSTHSRSRSPRRPL